MFETLGRIHQLLDDPWSTMIASPRRHNAESNTGRGRAAVGLFGRWSEYPVEAATILKRAHKSSWSQNNRQPRRHGRSPHHIKSSRVAISKSTDLLGTESKRKFEKTGAVIVTNLIRWKFIASELPMPKGVSASAEEEPNNERGI